MTYPNDGLAALRAGPLNNPIPATWTETAGYECVECHYNGLGTVELEAGGSGWSDQVCDDCGSDNLEWSFN